MRFISVGGKNHLPNFMQNVKSIVTAAGTNQVVTTSTSGEETVVFESTNPVDDLVWAFGKLMDTTIECDKEVAEIEQAIQDIQAGKVPLRVCSNYDRTQFKNPEARS